MTYKPKSLVTVQKIATSVAVAVVGSGNNWQRRWQLIGRTVQPIEKQQKRVANTAKLPKWVFSEKKQRLTLFCSLLRYVWKKYEVRRAEWTQGGPKTEGMGLRGPANGMASCAAFVLSRLVATPEIASRIPRPVHLTKASVRCHAMAFSYLFRIALCAVLTGPVAAQSEWNTSGAFDLKPGAEQRERAAKAKAKTGAWSASLTTNEWSSLDAFERGKASKPAPSPSRFTLPTGPMLDQLFAVIAFAESPRRGYDAIHGSATRLPAKPPTQLTIGQIKAWIKDTPGQHHAIGNFQIIPSTLLNLQRRLRLPDSAPFNRSTQDKMGALLVSDAGYERAITGSLSLSEFMDNLARIWAGLPLATGKSAYHGYAGNRATVTRSFFAKQIAGIFG